MIKANPSLSDQYTKHNPSIMVSVIVRRVRVSVIVRVSVCDIVRVRVSVIVRIMVGVIVNLLLFYSICIYS